MLEGFVPAEEERGFGAVDAGGFVGDACGVFGGEAEEADGGLIDGEDFEVMGAGYDGGVEVAGGVGCGGVGAGGRDGGDEGVVVADLDGAAVGLDEVLDLEGGGVGVEGDPVPCCFGAEADAAHADHAVADVVEMGAEGEPAGGLGALGAVDVVSGEGIAGEAGSLLRRHRILPGRGCGGLR